MRKYKIFFSGENKTVEVEEGITLLEAERIAGLSPEVPCGGSGKCGKCLVKINNCVEKACQVRIEKDMEVELLGKWAESHVLTEGITCKVIPDLKYSSEKKEILLAAFDIGTTTVAGYLLDGKTGVQLAVSSEINPQISYGADVITRAEYTLTHGVEKLSDLIRKCILQMLVKMCIQSRKNIRDVYRISIVGNTCMHHIFMGIVPDSLVHAPYKPTVTERVTIPAGEMGLEINSEGTVEILPVIAGFTGADTVADLLAVNMAEEEKIILLIDLGTNGELVLGNRKRRIACSTAAGPAFEGGKIACGMRNTEGAIEHAVRKNGELVCRVTGDVKPAGICGSGLLDIIAILLDAGVIDSSGKLLASPETFYISEKMKAYRLFSEDESETGKILYISQKDIREFQLAKGAIAAGIRLLMKKMKISPEEVEKVYIAGAFGNYMNRDSACRVGLIPEILKDKIIPVGNTAGQGAKLAILNQEEMRKAEKLATDTEYLELALCRDFSEVFIDELAFPEKAEEHTK